MAPEVGFEPTTNWLTASYSTTELHRNNLVDMVRIELTNLRGAKPALSQLSYTPVQMSGLKALFGGGLFTTGTNRFASSVAAGTPP